MTNKELVLEFYDKVFNGHDLSDLGRYMREDYRQHSPEVAMDERGSVRLPRASSDSTRT